MGVDSLKPIKTEYKGIVFDSKSEAVFARCLDLAGYEWMYHPITQEHPWDFLATISFADDSYQVLIEYKPKRPTRTYRDILAEKVKTISIDVLLVFGNPWDSSTSCYQCDSLGHSNRDGVYEGESANYLFTMSNEIIQQAKSTRFDLC